MKKYIIPAALLLLSAVSCDLTETMQADPDKAMIFGSETGLKTYTYSFYRNMLPTNETSYQGDSGVSDYCSMKQMSGIFRPGAYNAETSTSWSWTQLRNVNYFLDGLDSDQCTVDGTTVENYRGIGRFFRAWFYYQKLVQYGEVPWFGHQIQNYEKDLMYKDRDSRDVIISRIIEDLDYAIDHISATSSVNASMVTKWVAAGFKSRVCLFEASFRKYHAGEVYTQGLSITADDLYKEAAAAARFIMDNGSFQLNTSAGVKGAYRDLFYHSAVKTGEVLLACVCDEEAAVYNNANWWFNSATYGNHLAPSRAFVATYLMKDGSRFTDKASWQTTLWKDEFTARDERLAQTVRYPGYEMSGARLLPDIETGVAVTGYHVIKFSLDDNKYEGQPFNINSIPIMRYPEILLNYAEAQAELGLLTDEEWAATVGTIRSRAGITGGLDKKPTSLDTYMQETFYPSVTDPTLMEIRRERAVELALEGFRKNDLIRWNCGKLIESLPWTGIHIPALDTAIDLDGDGTGDYWFSESSTKPSDKTLKFVQVGTADGLKAVANPDGGYDLVYDQDANRCWYDDNRQTLYPIPAKVIRDYAAEGYTLKQNPGWEE